VGYLHISELHRILSGMGAQSPTQTLMKYSRHIIHVGWLKITGVSDTI
jgi:hypothetical protein